MATSAMEVSEQPHGEQREPSRALTVHQPMKVGLLRPVAPPEEVIASQEETRSLISKALQPKRDYGLIPGTQKETLFKAGAERIVLAFGCYARFIVREKEVDHNAEVRFSKKQRVYNNAHAGDRSYTEKMVDGISHGIYRYVIECEIVFRETDSVVGAFIGSCSSLESKYIDRPRDTENTIIKMAEKRALVGAALTTFGLSDQFTQDTEDMPDEIRDRTANEARDVAGKDDPSNDWTVPFGDHRGKSVRQMNPDGSYLISDADLASSAKWCAKKRDEEQGAGRKKFESWLEGFETEIARRAAEKAQAPEQQSEQAPAAASAFKSRYAVKYPMGNLRGRFLDEIENGEYVCSADAMSAAFKWVQGKLDGTGGGKPMEEKDRPKFQLLRESIEMEMERRRDEIDQTAASIENQNPAAVIAEADREKAKLDLKDNVDPILAKNGDVFSIKGLTLAAALMRWQGVTDSSGHTWTEADIMENFNLLHGTNHKPTSSEK